MSPPGSRRARSTRSREGFLRALPFSLYGVRRRRAVRLAAARLRPCAGPPSRLIGRNRSHEPPPQVSNPLDAPAEFPPELPPEPPARTDPDAAGRLDGLCRPAGGDSPGTDAVAIRSRRVCHRDVRLHPETLRSDAARDPVSRRRRRQGLVVRDLFAAARQSQPYRIQRAVAVAVRQRAGAALRRDPVFRIHGGHRRGRRAGASRHP